MIFFYLSLFVVLVKTNFIIDGGFQDPPLASDGFSVNVSTYWIGNYFDLKGPTFDSFNFGYSQYLDLQSDVGQNGFIEQTVSLPFNGSYELTYLQMASTTNYWSYILEIHWNNVLIVTKFTNTISITNQSVILTGVAGNNVLKFQEIGDDTDVRGTQIDEVSLVYVPPTDTNITNSTETNITNQTTTTSNDTNQNTTIGNSINSTMNGTNSGNDTFTTNTTTNDLINSTKGTSIPTIIQPSSTEKLIAYAIPQEASFAASAVLSMPLNQLTSLKYVVMFVDDLWLFYYDNRNYSGVINDIFRTITRVQNLKFEVLAKIVDISTIKKVLPFSSYQQFTRPQFLYVQNCGSTLTQAAFPFFILTIPSNILYCLLLYAIFRVIADYKLSIFIRRFYFFKSALFQILFQGNLSYFVFVSFSHLKHSFTFAFHDKLDISFTIIFLFAVLMFAILFYLLLGKYLVKQSCYFIYCFYRSNSSFVFLTVNNLIRGFLRGSIHFFLHYYYKQQIISLCFVQVLVISWTILAEKIYEVFIPKIVFCLFLLYHALFVMLNISLYLQKVAYNQRGDKEVFENLQQVVVVSLMVTSFIMMVIDLIPYQALKSEDYFESELQNLGENIVETKFTEPTKQQIPQRKGKRRQKILKKKKKQDTESPSKIKKSNKKVKFDKKIG